MSTYDSATEGSIDYTQPDLWHYGEAAADRAGFSFGEIEESGAESGVDRRVDRALTEEFRAEFDWGSYWDVHSSSGQSYRVDLYHPGEPECDCPDDAPGGYCKHVWFIFLRARPRFLTESMYGLGTGR